MAATDIYPLSLHDALPIWPLARPRNRCELPDRSRSAPDRGGPPPSATRLRWLARGRPECEHPPDRKSTRLNSSHVEISYAVFCLKKKNYHAKYTPQFLCLL